MNLVPVRLSWDSADKEMAPRCQEREFSPPRLCNLPGARENLVLVLLRRRLVLGPEILMPGLGLPWPQPTSQAERAALA